jgi:hypothetical protein
MVGRNNVPFFPTLVSFLNDIPRNTEVTSSSLSYYYSYYFHIECSLGELVNYSSLIFDKKFICVPLLTTSRFLFFYR